MTSESHAPRASRVAAAHRTAESRRRSAPGADAPCRGIEAAQHPERRLGLLRHRRAQRLDGREEDAEAVPRENLGALGQDRTKRVRQRRLAAAVQTCERARGLGPLLRGERSRGQHLHELRGGVVAQRAPEGSHREDAVGSGPAEGLARGRHQASGEAVVGRPLDPSERVERRSQTRPRPPIGGLAASEGGVEQGSGRLERYGASAAAASPSPSAAASAAGPPARSQALSVCSAASPPAAPERPQTGERGDRRLGALEGHEASCKRSDMWATRPLHVLAESVRSPGGDLRVLVFERA